MNNHSHIYRIENNQIYLIAVGLIFWLFISQISALVFTLVAMLSIIYWYLNKLLITKMLLFSVKSRFIMGLLLILKLTLFTIILRSVINYFPMEALPLVTGITVCTAALFVEATYLIIKHIKFGD